jgi:hypothetical protein
VHDAQAVRRVHGLAGLNHVVDGERAETRIG